MAINAYFDESCHLENDGINVMVIGGIYLSPPIIIMQSC